MKIHEMKKVLFYAVAAGVFLLPFFVRADESDGEWGTLILHDKQGASDIYSWKNEKDRYAQRGNIDVKMQRVIMPLGDALSQTNVTVGISADGPFYDYGYYLDAVGEKVKTLWAEYNPSIFDNVQNETKGRLKTALIDELTVNFQHTEISMDGGTTWKKVRTAKVKGKDDADIFCCHATFQNNNFGTGDEAEKNMYGWTFFDEDNRRFILASNAVSMTWSNVAWTNFVCAADFRVRLVYDYPIPSELWITDHEDAGDGAVYLAIRPTLTENVTLTAAIACRLAKAFKAICATSEAELGAVPQSEWKNVDLRDPNGELGVRDGLIWLKVSDVDSALGVDKSQCVWKIVFAPKY